MSGSGARTFLTLLIAGMFAVGAGNDLDPYSIGVAITQPSGCPVLILDVLPNSPAERAGLKQADRLLAVDGKKVRNNAQAARLLRSDAPSSVSVEILRGHKTFEANVQREKTSEILARNGQALSAGGRVPLALAERQITGRLFPEGYPVEPGLFFGGFEILLVKGAESNTGTGLIVRGDMQMVAGDVETGPAGRAGLRPGDVIISANGTPVAGKTPDDLLQLFSGQTPETLRLEVERDGQGTTIEFTLAAAERVAAENGKRLVNGRAIPIWLADGSAGCHPR